MDFRGARQRAVVTKRHSFPVLNESKRDRDAERLGLGDTETRRGTRKYRDAGKQGDIGNRRRWDSEARDAERIVKMR